jgi:single-strand DNA-binding protein
MTMAGDTIVTVVGNLTADPELRFTPSGAAVCQMTVASTPRAFDRTTQEWKDQDTLFMPVTVWREQAENAAESLTKGTRVVAIGRMVQENWEDRNGGGKRSRLVLQADEVAPSLRYATAAVTRSQRAGGGQQQAQGDGSGWGGDTGGW